MTAATVVMTAGMGLAGLGVASDAQAQFAQFGPFPAITGARANSGIQSGASTGIGATATTIIIATATVAITATTGTDLSGFHVR